MPAKKKGRKSAGVVRSQATKSVARAKARKPLPQVPARSTKLSEKVLRESLRLGRARADKIIGARAKQLRSLPMDLLAAQTGLLIFEGDSWFSYPLGTDVRRELGDLGYEVPSVAHHGDRIEQMLEQLEELIWLVNRQSATAKAVLLSGGGNDIVFNDNQEFAGLLHPADSANPGWNLAGLAKRIDGDLQRHYVKMLASITRLCVSKWEHPVPILIHGYAHPVPDGRPALFTKPWLAPVFKARGYVDDTGEVDLKVCTPLMRYLIDRFNAMLEGLPAATPDLAHVTYVDLRPALPLVKNYKKYWDNELHPTRYGFKEVTKVIAAKLTALGGLI